MTAILAKDECNYVDIARFIGIYLVILGHFPYNESNMFFKNMIYSFHMPLFFVISGFLHNTTPLSIRNFKKIVFSLVIPYLLYNAIFLVPSFIHHNFTIQDGDLKRIFFVDVAPNVPTWFFITLFWVKLCSLFCKSRLSYIVVAIICVIAFYIQSFFEYPNYFGLRAALAAFPFFTIGYLLKDKNLNLIKPAYAAILGIVSILVIITFTMYFGRVDMLTGKYNNIVLYFIVGAGLSIATIYLSKYIPLRNGIIKTISRGTMLIVGTHWIITTIIDLKFRGISVATSVFISILITLAYYFPIRFSYKRLPALYGKYNLGSKKSVQKIITDKA